ncbi:MAG: SRPBCC domain-containing protein [Verrucomicrobiota bacterium]|nr:SRPBCC domain-containing protein [Verrucomicrobiota bacterium]
MEKAGSSALSVLGAKVKRGAGRTVDLTYQITIHAPVARIYDALTTEAGLKGRWTPEVVMSRRIGGAVILSFETGARHLRMIVERLELFSLVQWQCDGGTELDWIGTTLTFALTPSDDRSVRLVLKHAGWRASSGTLPASGNTWDELLPA